LSGICGGGESEGGGDYQGQTSTSVCLSREKTRVPNS
jgi:hypothetical protein